MCEEGLYSSFLIIFFFQLWMPPMPMMRVPAMTLRGPLLIFPMRGVLVVRMKNVLAVRMKDALAVRMKDVLAVRMRDILAVTSWITLFLNNLLPLRNRHLYTFL